MTAKAPPMPSYRARIRELFMLKARFAASSLVATALDYSLYLLLVDRLLGPVGANICAYSTAVCVNFLLQKRYVFQLRRSPSRVFAWAMVVSLIGLVLNTGVVWSLSRIPWFDARQYFTKAIATGLIFFYNFYFKRFVFERRFV